MNSKMMNKNSMVNNQCKTMNKWYKNLKLRHKKNNLKSQRLTNQNKRKKKKVNQLKRSLKIRRKKS